MPKIDTAVLFDFEKKIAELSFDGMSLDGSLTTFLRIEFVSGQPEISLRSKLSAFYSYYRVKYFGDPNIGKYDIANSHIQKGNGILTFISGSRHLFEINYPVFKKMGAENIHCIIDNRTLLDHFTIKPVFYSFMNELPAISFTEWRNKFTLIEAKLNAVIHSFCKEHHLGKFYFFKIKNLLLLYTQRLLSYRVLLTHLNPDFILVEHDRYILTSPIINAAKNLNIRTYTSLHGVINDTLGYTPILADKLFAWGDIQKKKLITLGAEENKIIISGAAQLQNKTIIAKEDVLIKLGLDAGVKIILLATNPLNDDLREKYIQIFCEAVTQLPRNKIKGIVRLHPSEDKVLYEKYKEKFSDIFIDTQGFLSYDESLAVTDIVCNFSSAYGIDALIKGKPVIIINIDDTLLAVGKEMIEKGSIKWVSNSAQLKSILEVLLISDHHLSNYENYLSVCKHTSKLFCEVYGDDATDNIIHAIQNY